MPSTMRTTLLCLTALTLFAACDRRRQEDVMPALAPSNKTIAREVNMDPAMFQITKQIRANWSLPREPQALPAVTVRFTMQPDGTLMNPQVLDQGQQKNSYFQEAATAAVDAIKKTGHITGLSVADYQKWHTVSMAFDPKAM